MSKVNPLALEDFQGGNLSNGMARHTGKPAILAQKFTPDPCQFRIVFPFRLRPRWQAMKRGQAMSHSHGVGRKRRHACRHPDLTPGVPFPAWFVGNLAADERRRPFRLKLSAQNIEGRDANQRTVASHATQMQSLARRKISEIIPSQRPQISLAKFP